MLERGPEVSSCLRSLDAQRRGSLLPLPSLSSQSHDRARAPALRAGDPSGDPRPQLDLPARLVGAEAVEGLLRRGARRGVLRPAVGDEGADGRGDGLGDLAAVALADLLGGGGERRREEGRREKGEKSFFFER